MSRNYKYSSARDYAGLKGLWDDVCVFQFYKILNPAWDGKFAYTKGAFSTTSFKTANGAKVILNTTSSSTGMASVKIISEGVQILFRFRMLW
jgi:hypothetical protein